MRVAVDIGGTFTDLVAIDESKLHVLKMRSTPSTPEDAFIQIIWRLLKENHFRGDQVERIIHVSTLGSNLFLGQIGIRMPKVALVTTQGFRDVIEIGRQNRSELYNVFFQRPKPLIPRRLRFEVDERIDSHGRPLRKIDETKVHEVADRLKHEGIEAVAISFLNSYLNPNNERIAKRILSAVSNFVFASSDVDPEHREYERASTTVVNSVLAPLLSGYLDTAMKELAKLRINSPVQLLSSSGGLVDLEEARSRPIVAIESGPAAGVVGASEVAKQLGERHVLSLDMGGTTAKAGCIVDYDPLVISEIEVGGRVHLGRIIKGSGYPVRYPSIDLAEVSAGGGTIIWSDEIGTLRVGPVSAGADPGPACYPTGGEQPTITDANLLLGRLGPVLLNSMELDVKRAFHAMQRVADNVGMDVTEIAAASIKLVNLQMARAVDIVSLERGLDPRMFSLITFGGAGPMHAAELAEQLGVKSIIIPPYPGLFSALGMMLTDMKYTYVKGLLRSMDELSESFIEETWNQMTREAINRLKSKSMETSKARIIRTADVRYYGQGFELEIPVATPFSRINLIEAFESKHEMAYGYRHEGEPIELTALRLTILLPVKKLNLDSLTQTDQTKPQTPNSRKVWFENEWFDTQIYRREITPTSSILHGPAVIEAYDSTILIPPAWQCCNQKNGCLILERKS
ncbi:MAG TPA: hydantoinase/oxoprolinase family protein [Candidatus Bathyarchaeia archaeon]|nr:hydantoinase/oxoprolinase family protein [Candidatus Bathyarchaeia archaeon]